MHTRHCVGGLLADHLTQLIALEFERLSLSQLREIPWISFNFLLKLICHWSKPNLVHTMREGRSIFSVREDSSIVMTAI